MTCLKCKGLTVEERVRVGSALLPYWHCLLCGTWTEIGHVPTGIGAHETRRQNTWRAPAKNDQEA